MTSEKQFDTCPSNILGDIIWPKNHDNENKGKSSPQALIFCCNNCCSATDLVSDNAL
jgi:hypothetical protein